MIQRIHPSWSIMKSEFPKELEPADRSAIVDVDLIRMAGKCPEPVTCQAPFRGVGRTLGGGSSSDTPTSEPSPAAATHSTAASSFVGLSVDDSLPSTSIQLRLADGTRVVARFNTHHMVGDIRAFIDALQPGAARTCWLQTLDFPPKQIVW